MRHISTNKSAGFTIIELLMAIILSGIIVTVFVSTLLSMVRTATMQKTQLELSQRDQIALDTIERDIRVAAAFDTAPAYTTFVDKYGPSNTNQDWSGTWSYKGSDADHRVLILRENATTTSPLKTSRTPVYIDGRQINVYAEQKASLNCTLYDSATAPTGALTYNATLPYYLIYFVRDGNLYRRILTDTTTTLCNTQYQKQSCPEVDTTPDVTCKAIDELIATDVASFTITYNTITSSGGNTVVSDFDAYSLTGTDIFDEINNVVVTLKLQKTVYGSNRNVILSTRVSRVH
jgi:type II secretory pathway pseudopilin PulG